MTGRQPHDLVFGQYGVKTRPPPLENRRMGGKRQPKGLEPPSAVGATKKPSKHRGVSRIRPALSHLVPHPKTFDRAHRACGSAQRIGEFRSPKNLPANVHRKRVTGLAIPLENRRL